MLSAKPARALPGRRDAVEYVVAAAVFLVLAVPVGLELRMPPTIEVTIVNPHEWDLGVDAVLADGGRVRMATIEENSTRTIDDVLHLEPGLRLRWSFTGEEIVVTTMDEEALHAADHRVTVPEDVARRLRALGVASSP